MEKVHRVIDIQQLEVCPTTIGVVCLCQKEKPELLHCPAQSKLLLVFWKDLMKLVIKALKPPCIVTQPNGMIQKRKVPVEEGTLEPPQKFTS